MNGTIGRGGRECGFIRRHFHNVHNWDIFFESGSRLPNGASVAALADEQLCVNKRPFLREVVLRFVQQHRVWSVCGEIGLCGEGLGWGGTNCAWKSPQDCHYFNYHHEFIRHTEVPCWLLSALERWLNISCDSWGCLLGSENEFPIDTEGAADAALLILFRHTCAYLWTATAVGTTFFFRGRVAFFRPSREALYLSFWFVSKRGSLDR